MVRLIIVLSVLLMLAGTATAQPATLTDTYSDDLYTFQYPSGWVVKRVFRLEYGAARFYGIAPTEAAAQQLIESSVPPPQTFFLVIEPTLDSFYAPDSTLDDIMVQGFLNAQISAYPVNGNPGRLAEFLTDDFASIVSIKRLIGERYVVDVAVPFTQEQDEDTYTQMLATATEISASVSVTGISLDVIEQVDEISNLDQLLTRARDAFAVGNESLTQALLVSSSSVITDDLVEKCETLETAKTLLVIGSRANQSAPMNALITSVTYLVEDCIQTQFSSP